MRRLQWDTSKKLVGVVALCVSASTFLTGCNGGNTLIGQGTTNFGTPQSVGGGTARSFVVTNNNGTPTSIGINFVAAALTNLPAAPTSFVLPLPAGVAVAPFDHLTLDWNPTGHEPAGVNDVPHFDAHFYMITQAERNQIGFAPNAAAPAQQFIPQDYISTQTVVPQMGQHWIDPTDPANRPGAFDKTLVYGFHNGRMNFIEPMFTSAFLQSRPNFTGPIKQPAAYPKAGYYPTGYSIRYTPATQSYFVAMENLQSRLGS